MKQLFPLLVVSLFAISCSSKLEVKDGDPVVRVRDKVLYQSSLNENIPKGLSPEDSTIRAEHFIRSWINDILLYDIAVKNNGDKETIDRLVENYRKSLVIYQYQERLINEKLANTFNDQTLLDFYTANKDKFKLDKPLIKGVFLKIPVDAPQIDEVRSWYKKTATPANREKLEKYCVHNAVIYDHFVDQWVSFNDVMNNLPAEFRNEAAFLSQNKSLEQKDDAYYYFLNVTEYLLPGDNSPFEYAKAIVQEMLINRRRIDFLKKTEEDIYERAMKKGEIKFLKE